MITRNNFLFRLSFLCVVFLFLAATAMAIASMHVAFALMIGWPLARLARHSVVRVLWICYPILMTFVIVVTANHFIVDALLGALTAAASGAGAIWLARARPSAWRFSTVAPARLTVSG